MQYSIKVTNYINGIFADYDTSTVRKVRPFQFVWSAMPIAAIVLAIWSMFFNGPAQALTIAHVFAWVFIPMNMFLFVCQGMGFMARGAVRVAGQIKEADRMMFMGERYSTRLGRFTASTDTWMYFALAVLAGWYVVAVFTFILAFAEMITKGIGRGFRNARRKEIDDTEQRILDHIVQTGEKPEETLEDAIRKAARSSGFPVDPSDEYGVSL